ncbi:MAG: hypothetical protein R3C53_21790 [Pirellulaceae bacterium]
MTLTATCSNGHKLKAKEKLAGKRVKCPKCGEPVKIPALPIASSPLEALSNSRKVKPQTHSPVAELVTPEVAPKANNADWLADLPADFSAELPGGSESWTDLSQPLADSAATPSAYAVPKAKQKPTESERKGLSPVLLFGGIGGVVGVLLIGVVAWVLMSGSGSVDNRLQLAQALESQPEPALIIDQPKSEGSESQPTDANPDVEPKQEDEPQVGSEIALKSIKLDPMLRGFDWPSTVWSSAYDEPTGRLAVTNDEHGVLIYDINKILDGKLEPVKKIPTRGLPTAVAIKPLQDKRVLVIAGQAEPLLLLVDMDTFAPVGKVVLKDVAFVDYVGGSSSKDDPYVYYSTANTNENNPTINLLGRVNLLTGEQDAHSTSQFYDAVISEDGKEVYARPVDRSQGWLGSWEFMAKAKQSTPGLKTWRPDGEVVLLKDRAAVGRQILDPSLDVLELISQFPVDAGFRSKPILFGVGGTLPEREDLPPLYLAFGSANSFRMFGAIPLPYTWFNDRKDRKPKSTDFRARGDLTSELSSYYYAAHADDKRELAFILTGENLVLAPLDQLPPIPQEPLLELTSTLPEKVVVNEPVEIDLASTQAEAVFEYVPNTDFLVSEKVRLLGVLPPGTPSPRPLEIVGTLKREATYIYLRDASPLAGRKLPFLLRIGNEVVQVRKITGNRLTVVRKFPERHYDRDRIAVVDDSWRPIDLATSSSGPTGKPFVLTAALNSSQTVIYVNDLSPFAGEGLPLEIQIGDERMTVTNVDDFRTELTVSRREGADHSVSSIAVILQDTDPATSPSLPSVAKNKLRWTPSSSQIGKHIVRIKARHGTQERDWFWNFEVVGDEAQLPFLVKGIEPQEGTQEAVVWGSSPKPAVKHFVGVYNVADKKLIKHAEFPKEILSAVLHGENIYACLNIAPAGSRQEMPTQVVRIEKASLKSVGQAAVPQHCPKIQVIAGKYLACYARRNTLRFDIPQLKPTEPDPGEYPYAICGRLGDRWLWDGVVWDQAMRKPEFLLFPVHFETGSHVHEESRISGVFGGSIFMFTQGPQAGAWFPDNSAYIEGKHMLSHYPGGLSCENGELLGYSWADPSVRTVGTRRKATAYRLIDRRPGIEPGYVAEANRNVQVALDGKLYSVPLEEVYELQDSFRFDERQDKFVLQTGKPNRISYSAPGARKYQLQLFLNRPKYSFDTTPDISAESTDGAFSLEFDKERFARLALGMSNAMASPGPAQANVRNYLERISPAYKALTGQLPKSVPVPVYVTVLAEHEDGTRKAGLAHSYLVEVPAAEFRKYLTK